MEEILHQLIWRIYHYLQGFMYLRWLFGISSINSMFFSFFSWLNWKTDSKMSWRLICNLSASDTSCAHDIFYQQMLEMEIGVHGRYAWWNPIIYPFCKLTWHSNGKFILFILQIVRYWTFSIHMLVHQIFSKTFHAFALEGLDKAHAI